MANNPRYLGLNEFVQQLSNELMAAPLKRKYRSERALRAEVVKLVKNFVRTKLGPLNLPYDIQEEVETKTEPICIFDTDFWPDLVIEVSELPTVAIGVSLIRPGESAAPKMGSAIGKAMIYSRQYPSVIAFILDQRQSEEQKHWLDREFKAELWAKHKVKLIIRP